MTDFRELCARMADELDHYRQLLMDDRRETHALATEARTALAQPNPPSLKEQAKFAAAVLRSPAETCSTAELQQHWHTICNALEQLND